MDNVRKHNNYMHEIFHLINYRYSSNKVSSLIGHLVSHLFLLSYFLILVYETIIGIKIVPLTLNFGRKEKIHK
jgi:hypothetical protein